MTTTEVADRLVALCKDHKNFDAMKELYADDIVSVEAAAKSGSFDTAGKAAVIKKSENWAAAHEIHGSNTEGPFLANDKFSVLFDFEVTPKATGKRLALREIAVYTVRNGKISREEFFYRGGDSDLAR
jgi:ketosteroid isomerase-like protein